MILKEKQNWLLLMFFLKKTYNLIYKVDSVLKKRLPKIKRNVKVKLTLSKNVLKIQISKDFL